MRIVLTGGGSGGHFYPLIAVAQELNRLASEEKLIAPELFFVSDSPYNKNLLLSNNIIFRQVQAGKLRRYVSLKNITDAVKTVFGIIKAVFTIYDIYPDVIFSKGGYASFPAVFAGRLFKIPVFIHESDSVPGRMNRWAGKFAERIAISYASAADFFPRDRTALTGNPIRDEIKSLSKEGGYELTGFSPDLPVILVLGGSQGAEMINHLIIRALPKLLENYQVIHQTGIKNYAETLKLSKISLESASYPERYQAFDYLDDQSLTMAAGISDVVISRAGASAISELANWGLPSIIIPISDTNGDHQKRNALFYARAGACSVIEEGNLSVQILISQIERITKDSDLKMQMSAKAKSFSTPDAAKTIAKEIIRVALSHEK